MHVLHPGIFILLSLLLLSRCSVRFQLLPRNSRLIRTICVRHLPKMSCVGLGDVIPNLEADSTHGRIRLHDWIGNDWAIIFSHPGDYTPVCTTELGKIAQYEPEFTKRGAKLLGLSTDTVEDHLGWIKDIESYYKTKINYPILADPDRSITVQLNMLDKDNKDPKTGKPLASRALHIVGPDKKLKLSFLYPGSTGRNFDEVVRVLDSLQLAAKKKVATPANWKQGDDVVVSNSLDNEAAKKEFPQGFKTADMPSGKDYLRTVKLS